MPNILVLLVLQIDLSVDSTQLDCATSVIK